MYSSVSTFLLLDREEATNINVNPKATIGDNQKNRDEAKTITKGNQEYRIIWQASSQEKQVYWRQIVSLKNGDEVPRPSQLLS